MTVPATTDDSISERITAATQRLTKEFSGYFPPQVVEDVARESLQSYEKAVVLDFVPLFVERFTRERLKASIGQPHA
jgi:hypothetical protein